jgi:hypothetical protein
VSYAIDLDLGPEFFGIATQVAGETVCFLTPRAADDTRIQERVRQFMKSQGRDCGKCGGCPVGQAQ